MNESANQYASEYADAVSAGQWSGDQMDTFTALANRLRQLALPYMEHIMRQPVAEDDIRRYPAGAALLQLAHVVADQALRSALADPYAGEALAQWRPELLPQQAWHFTYHLALSDLADDTMTRIISIRRVTRPVRLTAPPLLPWNG
jgi:hypothetical protein